MYRSKLKCSLRYIGYFRGVTSSKQVPNYVAHKAEWYQTAIGSEDPVTKSLSLQIVNALQLGDRGKASSLLLNSNTQSHVFTGRDFEFILEYCAKTPDPLFVMETWEILEGKDVGVSGKCYLDMIRALCNGGYLKEAFSLVKYLAENKRVSFMPPMYNCFLKACMKMQDATHVEQCLDLMKQQMVGKSEGTFSVLLTLAVWQKNLSAVHKIEKEFVKHYDINIIFLRKLIWSYTRLKDLKSAYATLQHMITLVNGDTLVKRNAEGKLYCPHLDIPVPQRRGTDVNIEDYTKPFSFLDDDEISMERENSQQCTPISDKAVSGLIGTNSMIARKILRWSFSDVIYACGRVRDYGMAEQLIVQMQSLGLTPSRHTYDGFIKAVISERGLRDAIEVLKIMQERNLKPYNSTLATVSTGCSRALNLDLSEFFLNQISKLPFVDPYNDFLEACNRKDLPERAIKMFAKMKEIKVKPNIRTYELLYSLFGNVNAPYEEGNMLSQVDSAKRITAIERHMLNNGIQHSLTSIRNLLKALGNEGMVKELMEKLHVAEKLFSLHATFLGTDIYNIVLHSLVEYKQSHTAIALMRSMRQCGLPMDAASYNIMIDCCSNIRCLNSAHAVLSLMLRDGFCPLTPTYTALAKILLDHDDFDGALNLLDQVILEGNQPDVLLYNTFLSKASEQGKIDIIELITEHMHRQEVQPDPSTCHYVFSAYAECEFFRTAVEALQVLSLRMISLDNQTLQEKRMEFEGVILSEDPETEKRIVQLFFSSKSNVAAALLNLRWCAMLGFSISWQSSESPWARRLADACLSRMNFEQATEFEVPL